VTRVLVTGGTGALGSELVPRLVAAGHDVVVLSRKTNPSLPSGVRAVRGDLASGEGLAAATSDVDVIAHLASGAGDGGFPTYRKTRVCDVEGTKRMIAAAGAKPHVVYISIVGVDRVPLGYYRAKLETEEAIVASGAPYTILRTTQWHTLAAEFCRRFTTAPVVVIPKGLKMQLLDVGEVADRMAPLVGGHPSQRVPDMGGPKVLEMTDIVRSYLRAKGRTRPVAALPLPGKTMRAFADGGNLTPEHADGKITWEEWLTRAT
jgi:uncharacterized protein YbjT (DUF2867 family)